MNCKPGDLAVIVRWYGHADYSDCVGRIVRVMRASEGRWGIGWLLEAPVVIKAGTFDHVADDCLRPIRDNDATDETLIGNPAPVDAERVLDRAAA